MRRYGRGWFGDNHRHYLAAKGIETKRYFASNPLKLGGFGSFIKSETEMGLHSQDPTEERSKEHRKFILEQRAGVDAVAKQRAEELKARQNILTTPVELKHLSSEEELIQRERVAESRTGETASEEAKRKRTEEFIAVNSAEYKEKLAESLIIQKQEDAARKSQVLKYEQEALKARIAASVAKDSARRKKHLVQAQQWAQEVNNLRNSGYSAAYKQRVSELNELKNKLRGQKVKISGVEVKY